MLPCRSKSCCWRWATSKLVDEVAQARHDATRLRTVLEQELGDSVLQKLLTLRREHAQRLRELSDRKRRLDDECATSEALRASLARTTEAMNQARAEEAECKAWADKTITALSRDLERVQTDLAAALEQTPEKLQQKLAEVQEQLEITTHKMEADELEHKKALQIEVEEKTDLHYKLKELRNQENKVLAKRKAQRRAKRGKS